MKIILWNLTFVLTSFAAWLYLDYLYVTEGRQSPWVEPVMLVPLFVGGWVNARWFRGPVWRRVGFVLLAGFAGILAVLALVFTVGIAFHFSIGGQW